MKFYSPQNVSGALQLKSNAVFSETTDVDKECFELFKCLHMDVIYTLFKAEIFTVAAIMISMHFI